MWTVGVCRDCEHSTIVNTYKLCDNCTHARLNPSKNDTNNLWCGAVLLGMFLAWIVG